MTTVSFISEIEKSIAADEIALPVFNATALKVQQELVKKEPNIQILEKLITGDQALSSQMLRMANSPFYRGLKEITTVKGAMIRLGIREVGRIVLLAATKDQFRSKDQEINAIVKKLWQHSAACAIASYWIAKRCQFEELIGEAFFAGLLHDVGKLFVLIVIDQLKLRQNLVFSHELVLEALDNLHTLQGYSLMKKWNMPDRYCTVARDHHLGEFEQKDNLLVIVRMANLACNKLGISSKPEGELNLASTVEAGLLGLTEVSLAELEIMLEDTPGLLS